MDAGPNEKTTLLAKYSRENSASYEYIENDETSESSSELHPAEEIPNGVNWHRWRFYLVELMVFILVFAYNLSSTIMKNQIIYQTCTAIFEYNETDCILLGTKNASNHTQYIEKEVQPYAARIFMTNLLIQSFVPALCGTFIGAWSDRFGRKPLLITAFTGYASYYIFAAIISYFAREHLVSPWYYLLAVLPNSLLGGSVTYSVATLCFISDVSCARERPYRMVLYEAAIYIGLMVGSFAAGFIYEATEDSTVVFAISAGAIVFSLLIIIFIVPESLNSNPADDVNRSNDGQDQNRLKQLFDVKLLKEMWHTCFKARVFHDRAVIWLTIVTLLTAAFVVDGSGTVFYLFIRKKFQWTVKEFTTYETISILIPIIGGNLFGILVLRKLLHVSLINLAILAFISQASSSFMKGFAFANWQIYLALGLGALKSIANPMCRTIIMNIVPANELGKVFSFSSVLQSFVPFIASPIYTIVYSMSLTSFPGFFNILSANVFLLAIAFLLTILRKKQAYPEHYGAILS